MAGDEASETMDTSALPSASDGALDAAANFTFQCCVCLDLFYKPIVLACGHVSCFWCVHQAMHVLRASHCAICRQPYNHFPSICQLLHSLLLKLEPVAYKRREKEVIEEEQRLGVYSPQLVDHQVTEKVHSESKNINNNDNIKANQSIASDGTGSSENGIENGDCERVTVDDVLCPLCKELLYQPVVLNCGHVYCGSCLSGLVGEPLECQVCQSLHPGGFPKVCLDLDHFLEEQFPKEYALRSVAVQLKKGNCQHGGPSSSTSHIAERSSKSCNHASDDHMWLTDDLPNVHVGVGCDSCGMFPIIGKRYKCQDCKEVIGFDLCEACYNTSSKLPGRFNQQHTADHKFELDDSQILYKILNLRAMREEDLQQDLPEAYIPHDDTHGPQQDLQEARLPDVGLHDHENHDDASGGSSNEDEMR